MLIHLEVNQEWRNCIRTVIIQSYCCRFGVQKKLNSTNYNQIKNRQKVNSK